MDKTETMRKNLKYFNLKLIASEAGVCYTTLASFRHGNTKTISTENYEKVYKIIEPIAKDILGE